MKTSLQAAYYWFAIFALTFVAYQLVQDSIRPNYRGENAIVVYLLGVAPNFFPSVGIPALFVLLIAELKNKDTAAWLLEYRHITANLLSQMGLLSWEFLQLTTTKGRFDWQDIIWTLVGGLVFQLLWVITPSKYKK